MMYFGNIHIVRRLRSINVRQYLLDSCFFICVIILLNYFTSLHQISTKQHTYYPEETAKERVTQKAEKHEPILIHYIWIHDAQTEFPFVYMISVLSVIKYVKPAGIIVWVSNKPTGKWWTFVRQLWPNIAVWKLQIPKQVYNKTITITEHQTDLARIDILLKYGGVYLDLDTVILQPLDKYYKYDVTMGAESPNLLSNGLIIAKKNARFLSIIRSSYQTYNASRWNFNSVILPMELAKKYPDLVHVEWFYFLRPNWFEREWLYVEGKLWDWSGNYAIHLFTRAQNQHYNPTNIRCLNTTSGEVLRYVYYGNYSFQTPCRVTDNA